MSPTTESQVFPLQAERSAPILALDGVDALKSLAAELFQGEIRILTESDPEIPHCDYLVVEVLTSGTQPDLAARRREWYLRTHHLLGADCDKVRLSLSFQHDG